MKLSKLKYDRLTVTPFTLSSVKIKGRKRWFVNVVCKCGTRKTVNATDLEAGKIKSCGCLALEKSIKKIKAVNKKNKDTGNYPGKKHGDSNTPFHNTWKSINGRCYAVNNHKYHRYGGRGISVEWESYEDFKKDMFELYLAAIEKHGKKNISIDRIDNDGNYSKSNCRWATPRQQANNTSRNRKISYRGITMTVTDWSRELGINRSTINSRINILKLTDPEEIFKI
jgi:hypothetical protein